MAKVEILVDSLKLSRKPVDIDFQVETGISDLLHVRERIRDHLRRPESTTLRVRLDEARYRKVADLDGINDLLVVHVTPRTELAAVIDDQVPHWCSSATIAELGLLNVQAPDQREWANLPCDLKLLHLLDPRFLDSEITPEELLYLFFRSGKKISPLRSSDLIVRHFTTILSNKLDPVGITRLFECLGSENYAIQFESLFRQIFQEKIKAFTNAYALTWTFNARHFSEELTEKLELTDDWWKVIGPDADLALLTDRILLKINAGVVPPDKLSEVIWTYSKSQLDRIDSALQHNPKIATQELLTKISELQRVETDGLERRIIDLLEVESPGSLAPESTAKQAMEWAQRYLTYARSMFRREEEPIAEVSASFSDWVYAQPQRVSLKDFNWRLVASTVKEGLERGSDVILLVIDAFGAIVSDRLVQRLQQTIDWQVSSKMLFGPLPTITEVAKMAVASGVDVFQLPSDKAQALRYAYSKEVPAPEAVQFSSSWKEVNVTMNDMARLMVVFENQFDEQVHQCATYADLDAQLEVVCAKVTNSISRWIKVSEVRQRPLEIYISADHGMARVATGVEAPSHPLTRSIKERCIEVEGEVTQALVDGYLVTPEGHGKSNYLIPRRRVKFCQGLECFVHGGLSPEEVLIPLITVRRSEVIKTPDVQISSEQDEIPASGEGWTVTFKVRASATHLRRVQIVCEPPFSGHCTVENILEQQSKLVTFNIRSTVHQEGAVNLMLNVAYVLLGGVGFQHVQLPVSLKLRPHMLIREQGSADFDNMFD
ncbi:hypothetical protein [Noviherbaspirillum soli]|uniref:hypothetical protein n=1 Tax=Noviherbaspirillum soli TaxID=1064518 RepID=UPI00188D0644|nr:hypothetical protein [Noviherbaspirillum soli]